MGNDLEHRATPSANDLSQTQPASSRVAPRMAPESLVGVELAGGRFRVVRTLGSGGMGVVYEAYDRERDEAVALKHIVHSSRHGGHALKAEFRSLADVHHPNVVRLHELFCEEDPCFFTMDLVSGVDFMGYVRGWAARLREVFNSSDRRITVELLDLVIMGPHLQPTWGLLSAIDSCI